MKVLHTKTLKNGNRHLLIEISRHEQTPVQPLDDDKHYRLAEPLEDQIYAGYIIKDPTPVTWDNFEQKWLSDL